jgi:hypothetical protein
VVEWVPAGLHPNVAAAKIPIKIPRCIVASQVVRDTKIERSVQGDVSLHQEIDGLFALRRGCGERAWTRRRFDGTQEARLGRRRHSGIFRAKRSGRIRLPARA